MSKRFDLQLCCSKWKQLHSSITLEKVSHLTTQPDCLEQYETGINTLIQE